jgi:hypothetical protein
LTRKFERVAIRQCVACGLDLFEGNGAHERRTCGKLFFGEREWRAWFFSEAIDVDTTDALHAAVGRVSRWRGPTEYYFVSLLRTGEQFSALLDAFDRRQGRSPLPAPGKCRKTDQTKNSE